MGKAVLLSVRPEWAAKIILGDKTIEVRKTRPRLETPFKVYIYCTLAASKEFNLDDHNWDVSARNCGGWPAKRGRVIAEFTCYNIHKVYPSCLLPKDFERRACMNSDEIWDYLHGQGWAWNISDLQVYDKPVELNRLSPACLFKGRVGICNVQGKARCQYQAERYTSVGGLCAIACQKRVERAPQSWCYVEEGLKDAKESAR